MDGIHSKGAPGRSDRALARRLLGERQATGSMGIAGLALVVCAVNLASRIEQLNKLYDTTILVSDDTRALIADRAETRLVDETRVEGRRRPVVVHELLAFAGRRSGMHRAVVVPNQPQASHKA